MSKNYSASKHLYTLNQSKQSLSPQSSHRSSSSLSELDMLQSPPIQIRNNVQALNQQLSRRLMQMQLRNQEMADLLQLGEKRCGKHEEKQKEMIKKMSYLQVENKQLNAELKKFTQDAQQIKEHKKVNEQQILDLKQAQKRFQQEKDRYGMFLRGLVDMLSACDQKEDFIKEKQKIIAFIAKNLTSGKVNASEFDLKFEMSRLETLKERIKTLELELQDSRKSLQAERASKKALITTYTQKITSLRSMYDGLRTKVNQQQEEHRHKVHLLLQQKNETIQNLKSRLRDSRHRKDSSEIGKKGLNSKKSYIGDGGDRDFDGLRLEELDQAIEDLQRKIVEQLNQ